MLINWIHLFQLCSTEMQKVGSRQSSSTSLNEINHGSPVKNDGQALLMLNEIQGMLQPQTTIDAAANPLQKIEDQQVKVAAVRKNIHLV